MPILSKNALSMCWRSDVDPVCVPCPYIINEFKFLTLLLSVSWFSPVEADVEKRSVLAKRRWSPGESTVHILQTRNLTINIPPVEAEAEIKKRFTRRMSYYY